MEARQRSFQEALAQLRDDFKIEQRFKIERQHLPPTKYKEEEVYNVDRSTGEITVSYEVVKGGQLVGINSLFGQYLKGRRDKDKTQREIRLEILSFIVGRRVGSSEEISRWECSCIIGLLKINVGQKVGPQGPNPEEYWQLSEYGGWFLTECEATLAGKRTQAVDSPGARTQPAPDPQPAKRPVWGNPVPRVQWGTKR